MIEKAPFKSPLEGYRVPTSFKQFEWRKVPADFADFISPDIEITADKVEISMLKCADYADHCLLSEANLRNQRKQEKPGSAVKYFFINRNDKICEIRGNLTPAKLVGTR